MSSRSSSPDVQLQGAVGGEGTGEANVPNRNPKKMDSETESLEAGMQEFYNNNRRELMFELRRIQHGEKPVTGQQHRDNINNFLSKHLQVHTQNAGKENVPANVDRVEEHRPEAVVVEVEGLYEQRPVSSLLRSTAFRRHLDNIIRQSMSSFTLTPRNSQSPSPRVSHQASPAPASQDSPLLNRRQPASRNTASPRPSVTQDDVVESGEPPVPPPAPEPRPVGVANPQGNRRDVLHPPENVEAFPVEQPPQGVSFEEGMRIQRETIVEEISELVHRGLVSSSLEGEFRGTLELHMQDRLGGIGDGERVRNAIRSLPHDPLHRRNDFSHLGIPLELDSSDNISVTSISAAAVPYTQTNLHLSREMNALRTQVEEMRNMLKMNMELQMDIQRAIRQEVAAAVSTATAVQAESSTNSRRSQPVQASDCLICLENSVDSVLYQCGHMCVCYLCGKHLIDRSAKCPVCRAPIRDIIRAYKCNSE